MTMCLFHIAVRISNKETPCTTEATDRFNEGHIKQCVSTYATAVY